MHLLHLDPGSICWLGLLQRLHSLATMVWILMKSINYSGTCIRYRSSDSIREPWKYLTLGYCFFKKPSNSSSGSSGCRNTASTSTSSLSSWWKSERKLVAVSKVMWPVTFTGNGLCLKYFCQCIITTIKVFPLSFLYAPPYFLLVPTRIMASGITVVNIAKPTTKNRIWNNLQLSLLI